MSFQIGKSVYENKGSNRKFFYLEPGNNVYRILPPMFSLAAKGLWYKYWGVHKGFVNSAGKYRPVASIEEFDVKTKTIRVHDPVSDKYRENLAKATAAKDKGMPAEKIKEFSEVYVRPYDTDKKYYVNAVNQANEIGVLVIPSKLFQQVRALCKEYEAKNIDLTGMKGIFFNLKKIQAFKGDTNTTYSCDIFREDVGSEGLTRPKIHEITQDFVIRLQNEAKDLTQLFTIASSTDLQLLADAQPTERGPIIDRIFGKSEADEDAGPQDEGDGTMGVTIPNTGGAQIVGTLGLGNGDLSLSAPAMPAAGPATPPVSAQTQAFINTPAPAPTQAPAAAPAASQAAPASALPGGAPAQATKPAAAQDFDSMFASMFGAK